MRALNVSRYDGARPTRGSPGTRSQTSGPSWRQASRMSTESTLADGTRAPQRATSLAHLRRRASEKEWPEARSWCERRNLNKGYVLRKKGKPDPTPARAEKRTTSRYYQLKSGCVLEEQRQPTGRPLLVVRPG